MKTKKISFPTFEVDLWKDDGTLQETIMIRPTPFNRISEVKDLQIKLMESYELHKGCLGELMADNSVAETMRKISALLRVVGQEKLGMNFDNLYDSGDIVQMGRIFFSESIDSEMRSPGYTDVQVNETTVKAYQFPPHRLNPLPSAIARIHDLAFFEILIKIREETEEKENEREKGEQNETQEQEKSESLKVLATPA